MPTIQRVIGLMSGTSLDGVDAAVLDMDGAAIAGFGPTATIAYDPALRAECRALLNDAPGLRTDDARVRDLATRLTQTHAEAVAAVGGDADLIGFHGQTILHRPQDRRTWQIGDPVLLARLTGSPVAWDFRGADVAAGGQGAPLAPLFHQALAQDLEKPLLVVNIGGVANLTWIGEDTLSACDTGPGNALLDDWAHRHTGQTMDRDGALAASGTPDEAVLTSLLSHPFFAAPAPKSLDRLDFSHAATAIAALSPANGAATLAAFTARAIHCASTTASPGVPPPRQVLVTGGGRHNPAIMAALAACFAVPVVPVEHAGWNGDALEAQCFAYLAMRVKLGLPLSLPSTTGVRSPQAGGRILGL